MANSDLRRADVPPADPPPSLSAIVQRFQAAMYRIVDALDRIGSVDESEDMTRVNLGYVHTQLTRVHDAALDARLCVVAIVDLQNDTPHTSDMLELDAQADAVIDADAQAGGRDGAA